MTEEDLLGVSWANREAQKVFRNWRDNQTGILLSGFTSDEPQNNLPEVKFMTSCLRVMRRLYGANSIRNDCISMSSLRNSNSLKFEAYREWNT